MKMKMKMFQIKMLILMIKLLITKMTMLHIKPFENKNENVMNDISNSF